MSIPRCILLTVCLSCASIARGQLVPVIVQDASAVLNTLALDDPAAGQATLTTFTAPAGIEYNNLGYRWTSGLFYAVQLESGPAGNSGILEIQPDGTFTNLGQPVGLPDTVRFDAGDISSDGSTMYIWFSQATNTTLYRLDLNDFLSDTSSTTALTSITATGPTGSVSDWAYNPNNGLLYGGDQTGDQLAILNPNTGVRTDVDIGLPASVAFGAAWWDTDRNTLFLYENDGSIYEVDVTGTPSILNSWTTSSTSFNDATFAAVPEPSTYALLAMAACGGLLVYRRRQQLEPAND